MPLVKAETKTLKRSENFDITIPYNRYLYETGYILDYNILAGVQALNRIEFPHRGTGFSDYQGDKARVKRLMLTLKINGTSSLIEGIPKTDEKEFLNYPFYNMPLQNTPVPTASFAQRQLLLTDTTSTTDTSVNTYATGWVTMDTSGVRHGTGFTGGDLAYAPVNHNLINADITSNVDWNNLNILNIGDGEDIEGFGVKVPERGVPSNPGLRPHISSASFINEHAFCRFRMMLLRVANWDPLFIGYTQDEEGNRHLDKISTAKKLIVWYINNFNPESRVGKYRNKNWDSPPTDQTSSELFVPNASSTSITQGTVYSSKYDILWSDVATLKSSNNWSYRNKILINPNQLISNDSDKYCVLFFAVPIMDSLEDLDFHTRKMIVATPTYNDIYQTVEGVVLPRLFKLATGNLRYQEFIEDLNS